VELTKAYNGSIFEEGLKWFNSSVPLQFFVFTGSYKFWKVFLMNSTDKWQGSSASVEYKPGVGPFLALLAASSVGIVALGFLLWFIPTIGLGNIHPALPMITGVILVTGAVLVLTGAFFIMLAALKGQHAESGVVATRLLRSKLLRWGLFKLFLPLMVMVGSIVRTPKIKIEQAFLAINNQMVRLIGRKIRPERILILMPHCIQFDNCKIKVTRNVENCAGCGKCEVGNLLDLAREYGIDLFISTGGTVARRKVFEDRPHVVIAVACERDLTSGIQDAYPLPVYAIVNKRPHGYCMETGVDLGDVKEAIVGLLGKKAA
jgi:hypothetical protein